MRSSASDGFARVEPRGLVLELHVQPGARRDELIGVHGGRLKIKLAAPPVDGKANLQLRRFLATLFALPVGRIQLLRGDTTRMKTLLLEGASELPPAVMKTLDP